MRNKQNGYGHVDGFVERLPLVESTAMEGLVGLFKISCEVQEPYAICLSFQYDGCICVMCRVIYGQCIVCVMYVHIVHTNFHYL